MLTPFPPTTSATNLPTLPAVAADGSAQVSTLAAAWRGVLSPLLRLRIVSALCMHATTTATATTAASARSAGTAP